MNVSDAHSQGSFGADNFTSQAARRQNRRQWVSGVAATTLAVLSDKQVHAAQAGVVRIGQVLPLTGPLAQTALPLVEGQQVCIEEINAQGGVYGSRIEIVTLDDGFDPRRTQEQTEALLGDKSIAALFGYGTGSGIAAVLPTLLDRKVPLLALYTGADQLRAKPHPYLFTTTASYGDELRQMIRHLVTLRSVRLGVTVLATDPGRAQMAMVENICRDVGAEVLATIEMAVDGSAAAAAAETLVAKGPDSILVVAAGPAVAAFVKAVGGRVPIYTLSVAGSSAFVKALGTTAHGLVVSQVVPYPWRAISPISRQFQAAMARARLELSYDRMWGYLNASILVETLRRAGKQATAATITTALEGMSDVDLGGYRLNYSKSNHHGSRYVEITMLGAKGEYLR